jgi:hypothetical protein
MTDIASIIRVDVPVRVTEESNAHLREMGRSRMEGFCLWAGMRLDDVFKVSHCIVPRQTAYRTTEGVFVRVDEEGLHELNVWLYENGVNLIAQLHSHPTEAYHSELDDTFPITTQIGSFSLVIPDFASQPFDLQNCAVYRLSGSSEWRFLPHEEARQIIHFY